MRAEHWNARINPIAERDGLKEVVTQKVFDIICGFDKPFPDVVRYDPSSDLATMQVHAAQKKVYFVEMEEVMAPLKAAHAHTQELREAWERGAISEHDGLGGTRSNRNVEVEVALRELLTRLEG